MRGAGLSFPRAAPSASLGNLYGMPIHGKAVIIFGHAQPLADETSTVYTDNLLHLLHVSPPNHRQGPPRGCSSCVLVPPYQWAWTGEKCGEHLSILSISNQLLHQISSDTEGCFLSVFGFPSWRGLKDKINQSWQTLLLETRRDWESKFKVWVKPS